MSRARPLSDSMIASLRGARDEGNPYSGCIGRGEHGSRTGSVLALRRRGLLARDNTITAAGREALAAEEQRR